MSFSAITAVGAVKNFNFRENCVGSKMDVMKIPFPAIFDTIWTHILAAKGPNVEFIKQNFNFQSIRKTQKLYYYQLCDF